MTTLSERFWSKVDVRGPDECWPWTASCFGDGHGQFGIDYSMAGAHRVAWTLTNGPIPKGEWVLHKCNDPACCNPNHLYLGDHQDNVDDMVRSGVQRGERHHNAKLIEAEVLQIYELHAAGVSQQALAIRFGVCNAHINRIVESETWKHLWAFESDGQGNHSITEPVNQNQNTQ